MIHWIEIEERDEIEDGHEREKEGGNNDKDEKDRGGLEHKFEDKLMWRRRTNCTMMRRRRRRRMPTGARRSVAPGLK